MEYRFGLAALTEPWLPQNETLANQIVGDLCLNGYCMSHFLVIMVNEAVELGSCIGTASKFAVFPEIRTLLYSNSKSIF